MNQINREVAAEIRAEMARQNRTINELAEALGLKRKAAARRFRGETDLDLTELDNIASWLSIPIAQLITHVTNSPMDEAA